MRRTPGTMRIDAFFAGLLLILNFYRRTRLTLFLATGLRAPCTQFINAKTAKDYTRLTRRAGGRDTSSYYCYPLYILRARHFAFYRRKYIILFTVDGENRKNLHCPT